MLDEVGGTHVYNDRAFLILFTVAVPVTMGCCV